MGFFVEFYEDCTVCENELMSAAECDDMNRRELRTVEALDAKKAAARAKAYAGTLAIEKARKIRRRRKWRKRIDDRYHTE